MNGQSAAASDGATVTRKVDGSVGTVVDRLKWILDARGLKLFAVIDHSAEASQVGLELRDTKVVIFGNPSTGTPVMQSVPLAALDMPLKMLIWDDDGQTKVAYTAPAALADRYGLSEPLAGRLAGIQTVADELAASE